MTLAVSSRQAEAVLPLLRAALGGVEVRTGHDVIGLYLKGTLFGLVQDGVLLFRVDARTRGDYDAAERAALAPDDDPEADIETDIDAGTDAAFTPPGGSALSGAGFRRVPPFVLDDEDTLAVWGRKAWEAARRTRTAATGA